MRRAAAIVGLCVMVGAAPASAHVGRDFTEVTFFGAVPCATACAYWVDHGFAPCENPFPPGSWIDHVTAPAPAAPAPKVVVLEATLDMYVDWDHFLCANDDARTHIAQGANITGEACGFGNVICLGAHEDTSTPLAAGQTVIFRAYNWLDPLPATGRYWFTVV